MSLDSDTTNGVQAPLTVSPDHSCSILDDYAPPGGGSCPCVVYLEYLRNDFEVHQRKVPPHKTYTFYELRVVHAWHVKTNATPGLASVTDKPIREYFILDARLPDDDQFLLRVERVRESTGSIDSAPPATRHQLEHIFEKIRAEDAVRYIRSLPVDINCPCRPWIRDVAWDNDAVTLIDDFPPADEFSVVDEVSFERKGLLLTHAIGLATTIAAIRPLYGVFAEQGYLYTSTFMDLLKAEGEPLGVEVKVKEPETIQLLTKAGSGFSVPVGKFKASLFQEITQPEWRRLKYGLEHQASFTFCHSCLHSSNACAKADEKWSQLVLKVVQAEEDLQALKSQLVKAREDLQAAKRKEMLLAERFRELAQVRQFLQEVKTRRLTNNINKRLDEKEARLVEERKEAEEKQEQEIRE